MSTPYTVGDLSKGFRGGAQDLCKILGLWRTPWNRARPTGGGRDARSNRRPGSSSGTPVGASSPGRGRPRVGQQPGQATTGAQPQQWWQRGAGGQSGHAWHPRPAGKETSQAGGSAYGVFGVFGDSGTNKRRSTKPLPAVESALGSSARSVDVLDEKSVEDSVQKVLREDCGEGDVCETSCTANRPVKTGITFECLVTVAGQPKRVTVRVLNEQAQYEVGRPK